MLFKYLVLFLSFIASVQGISADTDKVKAIKEWIEPKTLIESRGFRGLVSFHRRFIKRSSIITRLITECLKWTFKWILVAHKSYLYIKQKMVEVPVSWHYDLSKNFELACDASGVGIGGS